MTAEPLVPFSPIPTEPQEMSYEPGGWTHSETPMRYLWEHCYRDAAHRLLYAPSEADIEKARELAHTGRAMEDAYLTRVGAEARARRAGQASSMSSRSS